MCKSVCAIIVTYNFDESFKTCLNSIETQVDEVIVVDNNSNEKCIEILKNISRKSNINVIFNEVNLGIAKAINKGIEVAIHKEYEWIITLDDDSEPSKVMIKKMLEVYKNNTNPNIGIISPNIYDLNSQELISDNQLEWNYIDKCIQSGSMIRSKIIEKLGMFNEELFIYYVDDDFCERVNKEGYKILRANNAILNHRDGFLEKRKFLFKEFNYNKRSNLSIYYRSRNSIYMAKQYSKNYLIENLKDLVKITLYSDKKIVNLKVHFKGIKDSIKKTYGICEEIHRNY